MLAIVLSRRDFREFDQMISLYTKERGKLELLARGVKKITSKNAAHLEPFSVVQATVEPGREIDHLIKVQPVEYFSGIREDLEKSLAARTAVSLTDTLTQVGERDARLFDTLLAWLRCVEELRVTSQESRLLIDGYIVQLFHCLGFTPVLDQCVVCEKIFPEIGKEELRDGKKPGFYFSGGGLVCPSCRLKKEMAGEEMYDCILKEVSDLTLLLKGDWKKIARFDIPEDEQKKVHRLVYEYAVYHSERQIPDWQTRVSFSTV